MNQKLPYEKLIADKLQDMRLPDEELMWQQMHTRLDAEMPVSPKRKPGGGGKWWQIGSMVIVIVAGIWLSNRSTYNGAIPGPANDEHVSVLPPAVANHANTNASHQRLNSAAATNPVQHPAHAEYSQHNLSAPPLPQKSGNAFLPENKTTDRSVDKTHLLMQAPIVDATTHPQNKKNSTTPVPLKVEETAISSYPLTRVFISEINIPATSVTDERQHDASDLRSSPASSLPDHTGRFTALPVTAVYNKVFSKNTTTHYEHSVIKAAPRNETGVITVPAYVYALPDVRSEKKKLLREIHRSERREERALAKSYKTYQTFWGEATDRWFAAGIAPYQNIAIGNQQSYHRNAAAGKNIITDYIPSPYLQLHVTNRIYLLSEFQFNSPQSTPSLLLSQKNFTVPLANAGYSENIYLRKLYYFNIPLSFYYSPLRNFYLGSGLQFSSFTSGLADVEQRAANNTLLYSETIKLKDDSLSSGIRSSEWRYLFDANYYYQRLMVGFRYNQALSNLVVPAANSGTPTARLRNQAFQFYIRYNLVVSGRRK
ncbi:MAG TPA: hypothetical protein PKV73_14005 [Agriterribacter sp.]|nr:hypothetical protein [Agriterribacter sp.]